jgi:Transglycosylase
MFNFLARRPAFHAALRVQSSSMLFSFRRRSAFLTGALLVAGGLLAAEIHGFAEAARVDYGKHLRSLSRREVLSLIALLVAPNTYSPVLHPAESAERVRRIERLLAGAGAPLGLADVELAGCR